MQCVATVFPDAAITPKCVDKYPCKVIIKAQVGETYINVWKGKQSYLFLKNASKRKNSQKDINYALKKLKKGLDEDGEDEEDDATNKTNKVLE